MIESWLPSKVINIHSKRLALLKLAFFGKSLSGANTVIGKQTGTNMTPEEEEDMAERREEISKTLHEKEQTEMMVALSTEQVINSTESKNLEQIHGFWQQLLPIFWGC